MIELLRRFGKKKKKKEERKADGNLSLNKTAAHGEKKGREKEREVTMIYHALERMRCSTQHGGKGGKREKTGREYGTVSCSISWMSEQYPPGRKEERERGCRNADIARSSHDLAPELFKSFRKGKKEGRRKERHTVPVSLSSPSKKKEGGEKDLTPLTFLTVLLKNREKGKKERGRCFPLTLPLFYGQEGKKRRKEGKNGPPSGVCPFDHINLASEGGGRLRRTRRRAYQ